MHLTLDTVRAHVAVDHTEDDVYLTGLMNSALAHLENLCGRAISETNVELYLDRFPEGDIELPWLAPVAVSSIKYALTETPSEPEPEDPEPPSESSEEQDPPDIKTVPADDYAVDITGVYPVVYRLANTPWPTPDNKKRAVTISATLGWSAEEMPEPLVIAALLLIGHWYANREAVSINQMASVPHGVKELVTAYTPTIPIG